MKPEQLSPEWVEYAYEFVGIDLNPYEFDNSNIFFEVIENMEKGFIQGAQHYQSKVVQLIEAKISEEQKVISETENYNELLSSIATVKIYKKLLTDLTNLKP